MAEDKIEPRDINFRQWLPWTLLFRGFWLALDHKKLLLAASGILTMAFGWWFLAVGFSHVGSKPVWPYPSSDYQGDELAAWKAFKTHRNSWNLRYEASGSGPGGGDVGGDNGYPDAGDLANSPEEFGKINETLDLTRRTYQFDGKEYVLAEKRHGLLRTWPWFEDRGPNPVLLLA